jgi:hypothetical protein
MTKATKHGRKEKRLAERKLARESGDRLAEAAKKRETAEAAARKAAEWAASFADSSASGWKPPPNARSRPISWRGCSPRTTRILGPAAREALRVGRPDVSKRRLAHDTTTLNRKTLTTLSTNKALQCTIFSFGSSPTPPPAPAGALNPHSPDDAPICGATTAIQLK